MGGYWIVSAAVVMVAVMASTATHAQTNPPSCASDLVPCANFLNSTKPPPSCCDPLRKAVQNELRCLCNLFNDKSLFKSLGINVTQAVKLPGACGIKGDLSACNASSPAPRPASLTPPAPAETAKGGKDKNGVEKIGWTGLSSMCLLLLGALLIIW